LTRAGRPSILCPLSAIAAGAAAKGVPFRGGTLYDRFAGASDGRTFFLAFLVSGSFSNVNVR
jgi:hypothetical protein